MQRHFIMFIEFNFCFRIASVHRLEKTLYIPMLQFNRRKHHYRKCCDVLYVLGVCVVPPKCWNSRLIPPGLAFQVLDLGNW